MTGKRSRIEGIRASRAKLLAVPGRAFVELKREMLEIMHGVQVQAVNNAPVRTGRLRRSLAAEQALKVEKLTSERSFRITYGLFKDADAPFYGPMVEYGTKGYQPGDKRRGGTDKQGRAKMRTIRRAIPARPAYPFLRPAWDHYKPRILEAPAHAVAEAKKMMRRD
jgi:hypothetical protein